MRVLSTYGCVLSVCGISGPRAQGSCGLARNNSLFGQRSRLIGRPALVGKPVGVINSEWRCAFIC